MYIIGLNEEEGEKLVESFVNVPETINSFLDSIFKTCGLKRKSKYNKNNIYQFERRK